MKETKYYCDVCGKEVKQNELKNVYFTAEGIYCGCSSTEQELCEECKEKYQDAFLELLEKINDKEALNLYKRLFKK